MSTARVFITPICQRILGNALDYVVKARNMGDPVEVWESLKTLYYISPPKVQEDCQKLFDDISSQVQTLSIPRSLRNAGVQVQTSNKLEQFLFRNNQIFLKLISKSLYERGYMVPKQRKIPSNIPEGAKSPFDEQLH